MTQPYFHYTRNVATIHRVEAFGLDVVVCGDPDNCAYEYAVFRGDDCIAHSDCAYSIAAAALRDGLTAALGE